MFKFHQEKQADATGAAIEMPRKSASSFGVIEIDKDSRVIGFDEKPRDPKPLPGRPDLSFVSMGIYLFNTKKVIEHLRFDALRNTAHDVGKTIIPGMLKSSRVYAYNFKDENKKERNCWRAVVPLAASWEETTGLGSVGPLLN